jgi:hypothetical protein
MNAMMGIDVSFRPSSVPPAQDAEKGFQLRSRLGTILNVPQRVRFRLLLACGFVG